MSRILVMTLILSSTLGDCFIGRNADGGTQFIAGAVISRRREIVEMSVHLAV